MDLAYQIQTYYIAYKKGILQQRNSFLRQMFRQ